MNPKLSYKTPDEYDPVINVVAYYPLLAVTADAPWKTIQEFVADGKANPGKMRVGTPGEGTASHLNLEEFIFRTGAKMTPVPYAGWAQSSPALLGKHIEAVVAQPGEGKAPACASSPCSRKSAPPRFRKCRPRRKRAGTSRTASGTSSSRPRARPPRP